MCYHCSGEAPPPMPTRELHDGWLFPHGRPGYVADEKIAASRAGCPWCPGMSRDLQILPAVPDLGAALRPDEET